MPAILDLPDPDNGFRSKLYELLMPEVIEQDRKSGSLGFRLFYDEAGAAYDDPARHYDTVGKFPVIQNLFWAIEKEEDADLRELENLRDLTSIEDCPAELLPFMSASLNQRLPEGFGEAQAREFVRSVWKLNQEHGVELSWAVFFRMLDIRTEVFRLWKREVNEAEERYSRTRYETTAVTGEAVGPVGETEYLGSLASAPVKPGSVRFKADVVGQAGVVFRDTDFGVLESHFGGSGTIDYGTGQYRLTFPALVDAAPVTADYEGVDAEFPFHAARVDFEVFLVPISGGPQFVADEGFEQTILDQIEQVRPITVLLRAIIFVLPLTDTIDPMANDCGCCAPSRAKGSFPGSERWFFADQGTVPDDSMRIEHESGGTVTTELILGPEITALTLAIRDVGKIEYEEAGVPTTQHV